MDGRTIEALLNTTMVMVQTITEYIANKTSLLLVQRHGVLVEVRLPVTQHRTTLVAVHRSQRQPRSTRRLRLVRLTLRAATQTHRI